MQILDELHCRATQPLADTHDPAGARIDRDERRELHRLDRRPHLHVPERLTPHSRSKAEGFVRFRSACNCDQPVKIKMRGGCIRRGIGTGSLSKRLVDILLKHERQARDAEDQQEKGADQARPSVYPFPYANGVRCHVPPDHLLPCVTKAAGDHPARAIITLVQTRTRRDIGLVEDVIDVDGHLGAAKPRVEVG
ncbi:hypothetical protein HMPREF9695_00468 [Afipia broomeae ATCC 49717]|uniref:Uncharacterized protein n=1 Tax=Afipia broomeae ATCC 49717 TaxID=883078 RepID=K8PIM6_9BRAD|nr:hypothetical protein HMPREF9695_00468 [Afipia broomeae ATCC 49717]